MLKGCPKGTTTVRIVQGQRTLDQRTYRLCRSGERHGASVLRDSRELLATPGATAVSGH